MRRIARKRARPGGPCADGEKGPLRRGAQPVLTDAAATTSGATVFRGGIWNVASRIIPQVYVLIVSVAAARFLGPDGLGRQSFIGFVQVSVTMLLSSGLAISLMRYVGEAIGRRGGDAVRGLIVWGWRLQAAGAAARGGGGHG